MMDWKSSLDRWLTSDPNEGQYSFIESLIDSLSDQFYSDHEDWINDENGTFNKWVGKLYSEGRVSYKEGAAIIERAYKFYRLYIQTPKSN